MKIHVIRVFLFVLCLLFPNLTIEGYNLRKYSHSYGLSNSAILSLCQDKEGFVWLGTYDGLNLYDGISIRQMYDGAPALLSGNIIENIVETREGILWVQTNYGLDKVDKRKRKVTSYTQFQGGYFLRKDEKGNVFLLSPKNVLHSVNGNTGEAYKLTLPGLPEKIINLCINSDNLWVFAAKGITRYSLELDKKGNYVARKGVLEDNTPVREAIVKDTVTYVVDGRYDLYRYDLSGRKQFLVNMRKVMDDRGDISDIVGDKERFFVSFKTNGVLKYTYHAGGGYQSEDIGIRLGTFCMLQVPEQDIVWIGTDGDGAYLYSEDQYDVRSISYGELNVDIAKPIRSVWLDEENTLWLGTKGEGILRIPDFSPTDVRHLKAEMITDENSPLSDNQVYAFAGSSRPLFWIGTDKGICYYSYHDKQIRRVACDEHIQFVHAMYEENDTVLWIATVGTGILRAHIEGTKEFPRLTRVKRYTIDGGSLSSNYFFAMHRDAKNQMWFGNRGYGVFRMTNNKLQSVPLRNNYTDKTANDIFGILKEDSVLWLGTSHGLIRQTPVQEICFNKKNVLSNSSIHTMLKDNNNNLWLATNNGLIRFDMQTYRTQHYNQHSGLNVIEFSDGASLKKDGLLYFGGINGLVIVQENPCYHKRQAYNPPLRFTRLSILGKEENLYDYMHEEEGRQELKLEYNQNFFQISFFVMDYTNSNNYDYLYKIGNEMDEWIDNGLSNSISFTQMQPGNYTLYIKYRNKADGTESLVYPMHIRILPPWYLSWLAVCLYILSGGIIIFLFVRRWFRKQQYNMMAQLEQTHKEELYEEKLRFFTNITHEFCTPLTLIYGPCERILSYTHTDAYIAKYVNLIKWNAERLNALIQEVIDFRRIETGHQTRNIQPTDISKVCGDIIGSFSDLAEQSHIRLETFVEPNLSWNTDCSCFTKIVNNLISNAFKYTPQGGTIRITLRAENGQLLFSVYNTGKGIRKEDMLSIFNRYRVLDNVKENSVKGLSSRNGLGMAICHSMVELLEGVIDIRSEVNQYAEFMVTLPYLPVTPCASSQVPVESSLLCRESGILAHAGHHIVQPEKTNRTSKILVIDDNEEILSLLQDVLSDYEVITAQSGDEGLECLKRDTPEVIITDVMMPGTDGIELTRQIKKNKHTMHIPLIILSAKNANEEKIEGVESGADAYIGKPFDVNYLKAVVARLIENKNKVREYYNSSACAYEYSNGRLMEKEDKEFLASVTRFIEENIANEELGAEALAGHLQMSVRNLYRKFKELELLSPKEFIKEHKITYAAKLLATTNLTIQEIMYQCGFINRSHFYKEFAKRYEMTPKDYRNHAKQKDDSLN